MKSEETRGKWRQRIEAQEAGGLTVTEYCRREGVSRVSMFQWRRKLGYTGMASAPAEAVPRRRGEAARAHWAALIGEQAASGESVTAWCGAHKVSTSLFFKWKRCLETGVGRTAPKGFVELKVGPAPALVLESPEGWRIALEPGFDAALLRRLVGAWGQRP